MNTTTTTTYTAAHITAAIIALEELTEAHFELLLCLFQYVNYELGGFDAAGLTGSLEKQMEDLYQANLVISVPMKNKPFNMRPSALAYELFTLCDENGCTYCIEPRDSFDTHLKRTGRQLPLVVVEEDYSYLNY